ncbi:hypothetical protein ACVDG5_024075 [Mesorhizobium sp. ORM6]
MDGFMRQDARAGRADLAGVEEDAGAGGLDRGVEIGARSFANPNSAPSIPSLSTTNACEERIIMLTSAATDAARGRAVSMENNGRNGR